MISIPWFIQIAIFRPRPFSVLRMLENHFQTLAAHFSQMHAILIDYVELLHRLIVFAQLEKLSCENDEMFVCGVCACL